MNSEQLGDNEQMQQNQQLQEKIRKDNARAGRIFIIVLIIAMFVGMFAGMATNMFEDAMNSAANEAGNWFIVNGKLLINVANAVIFTMTLVGAVWCMIFVKENKKIAVNANEEELEGCVDRIERSISKACMIASVAMIVDYFYFSLIMYLQSKLQTEAGINVLVGCVVFLVSIMAIIICQQKVIDLERIINPQKTGSVYDMNFSQKWMDSCDEAEKLINYKAAYRAYKFTSRTCIFLWVIFTIMGFVWDIGLLPVLTVLIIWAMLTVVYSVTGMQLEKNMNDFKN